VHKVTLTSYSGQTAKNAAGPRAQQRITGAKDANPDLKMVSDCVMVSMAQEYRIQIRLPGGTTKSIEKNKKVLNLRKNYDDKDSG